MIAGGICEVFEVIGGPICQWIGLEVAPEWLDRVELWRIRREEGAIELSSALNQTLDLFGAVSLQPIPDYENRTLDLAT